ncbi:hypothetical protein ACFV2H_25585 [Streptomyces sp. NPDC059629]|uniref:hypothetical protein n=1 Tax=Streptomyces sp. NPDC059629 TaxID=3346889 RepID=UPI0036C36E26
MADRASGDAPSAASLRERAARSFAVDPRHLDLAPSSTTGAAPPSTAATSSPS